MKKHIIITFCILFALFIIVQTVKRSEKVAEITDKKIDTLCFDSLDFNVYEWEDTFDFIGTGFFIKGVVINRDTILWENGDIILILNNGKNWIWREK